MVFGTKKIAAITMIREIFYQIAEDIDVQLSPIDFNLKVREPGKLYNIDLIDSDNMSVNGTYNPQELYAEICLYRKGINKSSKLADISILLHEFGHHKNIIIFRDRNCQSRTGFIYNDLFSDSEQIAEVFVEEVCAWKNAIRSILFEFTHIKLLTFWMRMIILAAVIKQSFICLFAYFEYCLGLYVDNLINDL